MEIIRAIVAGERDPRSAGGVAPAGCQEERGRDRQALTGNYRPEHVFALKQALALYDFYTEQVARMRCRDRAPVQQPQAGGAADDLPPLPPTSKPDSHSKNGPTYDARSLLVSADGRGPGGHHRPEREHGADHPLRDRHRPEPLSRPTSTSAPGWGWRRTTTSRAARCCAAGRSRPTIGPARPSAWRRNR